MKISVSYLKSLLSKEETLKRINNTSADLIHVDLMDGVFVPFKNFDDDDFRMLSKVYKPLDIHMMIENPKDYLDKIIKLKPEYVTLHIEALGLDECIKLLRENNIKVGLTLKPDTSLDKLNDYYDLVDLILVLSVNPGRGGQQFIETSIERLKELATIKNKYNFVLSVDGGINDKTINKVREYVDIIVSGSYICMSDDYENQIDQLRTGNFKTTDNLLKAYLNENYQTVTKKKFNILGIIGGPFYLVYCNMYLYSLIEIIVVIGAFLITKNYLVAAIFWLIEGLLTNILYIRHAKKMVKKIQDSNKNLPESELNRICTKKGKGSLVAILVLMMLVPAIKGGVKLFLKFGIYMPIERFVYKKPIDNKETYSGLIIYNSGIDIKEKLSIDVPLGFTDNSTKSLYNYNWGNDCSISLGVPNGYTNDVWLLKLMQKYYSNIATSITQLSSKTINNKWWFTFSYQVSNQVSNRQVDYYVTMFDKNIYLLKYEALNEKYKKCLEYEDVILNSLKFKE